MNHLTFSAWFTLLFIISGCIFVEHKSHLDKLYDDDKNLEQKLDEQIEFLQYRLENLELEYEELQKKTFHTTRCYEDFPLIIKNATNQTQKVYVM